MFWRGNSLAPLPPANSKNRPGSPSRALPGQTRQTRGSDRAAAVSALPCARRGRRAGAAMEPEPGGSSAGLRALSACKDEGNVWFKRGDYQRAIDSYTACVSQGAVAGSSQVVKAAYANRAAAYLKLSRHRECVEDCSRVLESDENHVKAYLRRGTALAAMGAAPERALEDFQACLRREPNNAEAAGASQEILRGLAPETAGNHHHHHHYYYYSGLPTLDAWIGTQARPQGPRARGTPVATGGSDGERAADGGGAQRRKDTAPIGTGLAFEKAWRSCRGDEEAQASVLMGRVRDPASSLPVLLEQCLTPGMLRGVLSTTLRRVAGRDPALAWSILEGVRRTARVHVNALSLPGDARRALRAALDALAEGDRRGTASWWRSVLAE
jgi:hypothetical protein